MARRNKHNSFTHGWVTVRDMHHKVLSSVDCSKGGAQDALEKKFDELLAEGWRLEGRIFDFQFANRSGERVIIGLYPNDPNLPLPLNQFRMPDTNR